MLRIYGDAEGSGHPQRFTAVIDVQSLERKADVISLGERSRERRIGQHQTKLFATIAAHNVAAPYAFHQQAAYLAQYEVAGFMAGRIVDALEMVKIDDDDTHRRRVALGAHQLTRQQLIEVTPVMQAGQRIGDRLLMQVVHRALDTFLAFLQCIRHFIERFAYFAELVVAVTHAGARAKVTAPHALRGLKQRAYIAHEEKFGAIPTADQQQQREKNGCDEVAYERLIRLSVYDARRYA